MGLIQRFNNWIGSHSDCLSAWSSVVTIISLPVIIISLYLGYRQIRDILTRPNVELVFVHPESVAYKIVNNSEKIAEDVLVSFGIFSLDSDLQNPVPISSANYDYVNKHSEKGSFSFFSNFGIRNQRYFGIVYISCRDCEKLRTYWIYAKHGDATDAFYAERNRQDTFQINVSDLASNTQDYLKNLFPERRRISIKR